MMSKDLRPDPELHGDADDDFLIGGMGADKLNGGVGNDILFDEGGSDTQTLWGGAGNDQLEVRAGTGFTFLNGGSGNDLLIGSRQSQGNALTGGKGNDTLRGGEQGDILMGDGGVADDGGGEDGADLIEGVEGDDKITGGGGADLLRGGADNDSYHFATTGFGTDLIEDSVCNNRLYFGERQLQEASWDEDKRAWVSGNTGMEIRKLEVRGSVTLAISNPADAKSTLYLRNWTAGQFGIALSGGPQSAVRPTGLVTTTPVHPLNNGVNFMRGDAVDGQGGNDILVGSDAASLLVGGIGNDLLDGRGGDDWLEGGEGNDMILTGDRKDVVYGGVGNDLIRAGYVFDFARIASAGVTAGVAL